MRYFLKTLERVTELPYSKHIEAATTQRNGVHIMFYQSANGTDYRAPDDGGYVTFSVPESSDYEPLTSRSADGREFQVYVNNKEEFIEFVRDPEWWPDLGRPPITDCEKAIKSK